MGIPIYNVYKRSGPDCIKTFMASVVGNQVSGPEAEAVKERLLEGFKDKTWPETSPDRILFGDYMWAEEVSAGL